MKKLVRACIIVPRRRCRLLGDGPDGVDDAGEVAEEGEDEADPELNLPDIENARVISSRHNTNKPEHSDMHAMRAQREDEEPTS